MIAAEYIWQNQKFVPWENAQTHVLSHGLHYGSGVFEGIRCYQTENGPAIFKLQAHIERFFYSAKQLGMRIPYSVKEICTAVIETIEKNQLTEAYIRPLAYYGYGSMKVAPDDNLPVEVVIACWPWKDYLPVTAVDVAISPFIRIHPKSMVTDAKISGHYVNSILALRAIQNSHYHETILLDADGFVAEGSAENIFIVKAEQLITPPKGTILVGITRDTVIEIANELGMQVIEKNFRPDEIYTADEAFFCGTAVEITAIRSLEDKVIGDGNVGKITNKIRNYYQQLVHGQRVNFQDALTYIKSGQEVTA